MTLTAKERLERWIESLRESVPGSGMVWTTKDELRQVFAVYGAITREEALRLVDEAVFDLPIGDDVTYSRGYSAGIAAAREGLRDAIRALSPTTDTPE